MKRVIITVSMILIVSIAILGLKTSDYRKKDFDETVIVTQDTVLKISMELGGISRSTTDKAKIKELFHFFEEAKYQRLRGDQTSYMPLKAPIIYFHKEDHIDFVVPYNDEAMISYKVYKVKDGKLTYDFLTTYYDSLKE